MKSKILLKEVGLLCLLCLLCAPAWAQHFELDVVPVYQNYTGVPLINYEAGGNYLQVKARIKTNESSYYLQSCFAAMGFKNPSGYETDKVTATGMTKTAGYNWDPTLLGKCVYYNTAWVVESVNHNAGEVMFSVAVPSAMARKQISTTPSELYQVNFHVIDGQAASSSLIKYDLIDGLGGQNKAEAASAATGGTLLGNKLDNNGYLNNFSINIEAAAPPEDFDGVKDVQDTAKGNTLKVIWDALSNKIEEKDTTPPIKYDIYRNQGTGSFTPGDGTNRKFTDENGVGRSGTISEGALADVYVLDGPNTGLPGTGDHQLNDCQEYRYIMRAKDSTADNQDSTTAPTQHKTTNKDTVISLTAKPHDYTRPEWTGGTAIVPSVGDTTMGLTWTQPGQDGADTGGYVVLKRGPFDTAQTGLTYPDLGKALGDEHGPEYTVGATVGDWTVWKLNAGKTNTTASDSGLVNGKYYYYAIYAYDSAGNVDGAYQQGRNYSLTPLKAYGVPGVPPESVSNFYALSRTNANEITLKWDNAGNYAAKPQGGTVVWYTSSVADKWARIPDPDGGGTAADWADPAKMENVKLLGIAVRADEAGTQESFVIVQDLEGNTLSTLETYFFKAFAYNKTEINPTNRTDLVNNVSAYRFSPPAYAAAAATLVGAGGAGLGGTLTFEVKASSPDKLVVNSISIPPGLKDPADPAKKTVIDHADQLISLINIKAGEPAVIILGKWDSDRGEAIGRAPDGKGENFIVSPGEGYQLYSSKSFKLELP